MTSSTAERLRRSAGALAVALCACSGAETIEIAIETVDFPCPAAPHATADLFVLSVHRLVGRPPNPDLVCIDCMTGLVACEEIDVSCRCGEPVPIVQESLDDALTGVRLEGLEAAGPYCVRMMAIESPMVWSGPMADCECPSPRDVEPLQTGRACGLSGPFSPGDVAAADRPIQVPPACPNAPPEGIDFDRLCLGERPSQE